MVESIFKSYTITQKQHSCLLEDSKDIFLARLKEIADGLGDELWNMLGPISRREEIQQVIIIISAHE